MSLFSEQEILLSVIIPTKNKPEYLFVTLLSFCLQTLPYSQFEVLVICNGENEESSQLNSYLSKIEWPFILKIVKLDTGNLSKARNVGINSSQGKYLVFVDDDCPVTTNFLENHLQSQINTKEHYVIGYTIAINAQPYLESIKQKLINNKEQTKILFNNDVAKILKELSENETSFLLSRMANAYHKNFSEPTISLHFPHWILFVARNLSIAKNKMQLFDNDFQGWGLEDWELGYRLYKSGIRALVNQQCINYHLNHSSSSRKYSSFLQNSQRFIRKHPEYQAFLGIRFDPRSIDASNVNQSIFFLNLESFVTSCHEYSKQKRFKKFFTLNIAKIIAYSYLIIELPKVIYGKNFID